MYKLDEILSELYHITNSNLTAKELKEEQKIYTGNQVQVLNSCNKYEYGVIRYIHFEELLSKEDFEKYEENQIDLWTVWNTVEVHFEDRAECFPFCLPGHSNESKEEKVKNKRKISKKINSNKEGYIYFILDEHNQTIKIGQSNNVYNRLRNLQTSSPYKLSLIGYIKGDYKKEKELHNKFIQHRLSGEWFNLNNDLMDYINHIILK